MALSQLIPPKRAMAASGLTWRSMTDSLRPESVPVETRLRMYHQPAMAKLAAKTMDAHRATRARRPRALQKCAASRSATAGSAVRK